MDIHSSVAVAQLIIRLRLSTGRQKVSVLPFCIAEQTPVGLWLSSKGLWEMLGHPFLSAHAQTDPNILSSLL